MRHRSLRPAHHYHCQWLAQWRASAIRPDDAVTPCGALMFARTLSLSLSLLCAGQIGLPGVVFEAMLDVDGHRCAARAVAQTGGQAARRIAPVMPALDSRSDPFVLFLIPFPSLLLLLPLRSWLVTRPQIRLRDETKTFAPANLRSAQDDPVYQKLVQFYLENKSDTMPTSTSERTATRARKQWRGVCWFRSTALFCPSLWRRCAPCALCVLVLQIHTALQRRSGA